MTVNMWKSYMWTAGKEMNMERILTIKNTTWATGKIRPEKKNSGLYEIKTHDLVIPVQHSTNWANKPTGCWLLCWFQINPWGAEQIKKPWIVKQILPVGNLRNIWRTVWRICILMLRCKRLNLELTRTCT